tara:strand:- start:16005 stop:16304 length:300 start_codon:yes stop_codon:yes gene_type:complete
VRCIGSAVKDRVSLPCSTNINYKKLNIHLRVLAEIRDFLNKNKEEKLILSDLTDEQTNPEGSHFMNALSRLRQKDKKKKLSDLKKENKKLKAKIKRYEQ